MPEPLFAVGMFAGGAVLGAVACFLIMQSGKRALEAHWSVEVKTARDQLRRVSDENQQLKIKSGMIHQALKSERQSFQDQMKIVRASEASLSDTFKALASKSLQINSQQFLQTANEILKQYTQRAENHLQQQTRIASEDLSRRTSEIQTLLTPLEQSLRRVEAHSGELERNRVASYSGLQEQVKGLLESQRMLQDETRKLTHALKQPAFVGSWGQIQLRRVVEMSGMLTHCDFTEQQTVGVSENQQRPDMVIHLPGESDIVVDAKATLSSFMDALRSPDPAQRKHHLREHAKHVRNHMMQLSKKEYTSQFSQTPDFVVMFLPGDGFLAAAVQQDEKLFDDAITRKVLLSSPTTLIALLKSVAYGWQQEQLTRNAHEICELGRELYDRLAVLGDHLGRIGKGLQTATEAYNQAIGSIEQRVLVSARRFKDLHIRTNGRDIAEIPTLEHTFRQVQSPELLSDIKAGEHRKPPTLFPDGQHE